MSPGLPKEYTEKTELREVICPFCNHTIASRMKIPRCKCGKYVK